LNELKQGLNVSDDGTGHMNEENVCVCEEVLLPGVKVLAYITVWSVTIINALHK